VTHEQIRAAIVRVLGEVAPEADLTTLAPGADLRTGLDLDSVDFLNVLLGLHAALGVDIPEVDYPKLATLEGAIAYLMPRVPGGTAPAAKP
jgi:acyl carrier protein